MGAGGGYSQKRRSERSFILAVAAPGFGEPKVLLVTPFMVVHPQQGPSSGEPKVGKY